MNISSLQILKQVASIASLSLLVACAQNSGNGNGTHTSITCAPTQNVSAAFHKVLAKAPSQSGHKNLLIRMSDLRRDISNFKADLAAEYGSEIRVKKVSFNTVSVDLPEGGPASQTIDRYIHEQRVDFIEQDFKTFSINTEDADFQATEDGMDLSAADLQEASATGSEVIVAVIDSGVDYTHKDLAPYMWKNPKEVSGNGIDDDGNGFVDDIYGWDFANGDNDPVADDTAAYHGTHVAGIVKTAAALAGQGIRIKIMALKYLDSSASGRTSNAIRAIDYAIQNGAKILNNSWGSFSYSASLADAVERSRKAKTLFIAAAGNGDAAGNGVDIDQTTFYPAAFSHSNIITVAAVSSTQQLAEWSNFGAKSVDLAAPGVGIVSTRNGNTYGTLSGTSMAAPYVSGVAATLWSLRPDLSFSEIRRVLFESAKARQSVQGKVSTGATVDPVQAVKNVASAIHDPNENLAAEPFETCAP